LAALLLSACAVPLAPAYEVQRQEFELHFVAAPGRAHLRLVAVYRLRNTGTRPLVSVRAILPDPVVYGRGQLRVFAGSTEIFPEIPGDSSARAIEIPLTPPWAQKQRLDLRLEYELAPPAPGSSAIAVHADSFHITPGGWLPDLRPPGGFLSSGGAPPEKFHLTVIAPATFRVFSAGRQGKTRRAEESATHRFSLGPEDASPFVVAGRFHESRHRFARTDVVFATSAALPEPAARAAAERLALARLALQSAFDRVMESDRPFAVVESPGSLSPAGVAAAGSHAASAAARAPGVPSATSFSGGALLNSAAFAMGVDAGMFLDLAEHEMAHTWFGHALLAGPEAAPLLSEGLAEYATTVIAEGRGGADDHRRQAARMLVWYDTVLREIGAENEPTIESITASSPAEFHPIAYSKGALFFLALEDEFGAAVVRRAIARLVRALRNPPAAQDPARAGLHDLRAALEAESSRTAADFFRAWLLRTGIPESFRSRYSPAASR